MRLVRVLLRKCFLLMKYGICRSLRLFVLMQADKRESCRERHRRRACGRINGVPQLRHQQHIWLPHALSDGCLENRLHQIAIHKTIHQHIQRESKCAISFEGLHQYLPAFLEGSMTQCIPSNLSGLAANGTLVGTFLYTTSSCVLARNVCLVGRKAETLWNSGEYWSDSTAGMRFKCWRESVLAVAMSEELLAAPRGVLSGAAILCFLVHSAL